LSDEERLDIIRVAAASVSDSVPVVSGSGHLSTHLAARAARQAVDAGARALLVPPPPLGSTSRHGLIDYYCTVARVSGVPIILQDDPVHLGIGISIATIVELANAETNIAYAKLEELPSMAKIRAVAEATAGRIGCLGGSGGVYVLEELAAGAVGIMTGFAFPEALVAVCAAWSRGDSATARKLYQVVSGLARLEALPALSVSIRKRLYVARGALALPFVRSPGVEVDPWTWSLVEAELVAVAEAWQALSAQ
jgi:4-hydroxy-tetrahydrodipicolinate synthase